MDEDIKKDRKKDRKTKNFKDGHICSGMGLMRPKTFFIF